MPYCPVCRAEFRDGFQRCSDCDAALVPALEPEGPADPPSDQASEDLVTIDSFDNPAMAAILASRLDAEGIEASISDAETISMDPLWTPAIGGVKVQVRISDSERAREIARRPPEPPVEEPGEASHPCPACGSRRTCKEPFSARAAFLSILFLGFPILSRKGGWKCLSCRRRWKEEPAAAPGPNQQDGPPKGA
jgi:hypothetical protein